MFLQSRRIRLKYVILLLATVLVVAACCNDLFAQGENLRNLQPSRSSQQPEIQPEPQSQPQLRVQDQNLRNPPPSRPTPPPVPQPQPQQPLPPLDAQTISADPHRAIQRLLAANARRRPGLADCTPDKILAWCQPYGGRAMATDTANQPVYAIGALCWNIPCQGKTLFRINGDQVIARKGYGYQQYPGSFLAMLAFSEISPDYEIKDGHESRTLAHLIATEKRSCARGQNLGLVLAGLASYASLDEQWANAFGETWSLERLVAEEITRRADQSNVDVTNQLLGLAAAVRACRAASRPLTGPLADAAEQLATYQRFALSIQNNDGTWHPMFFVSKGTSTDADAVLYASAHILRVLVYSLPQDQLQTSQVQRSVTAVAAIIAKKGVSTPLSPMSYQQWEGITVGLHALRIYDERVYGTDYSMLE